MTADRNSVSFMNRPVLKAVLSNAVPAVIAMIMVLVYNLADTFFIGQTHNDFMVAAVSLATPVFLIFMSLGTLFGIGGTSVISRALGEKRIGYARKVCSFCMWGCTATGLLCMILLWVFMDQVLIWLGTSANTIEYTRSYLNIVTGCGVFSMISYCFSNIIRAEGQSRKAMMGMLIGNLLNVILDPVMITGFGWGIEGAAIATVIGNLIGALYYLLYFLRGQSSLSIRLKDFDARQGIGHGVLAIGISASLSNILMSVSQIIVNSQMAAYGDMPVAAYGVAQKVMMIVSCIGVGVGQGIQPLLGYCIGAKDTVRYRQSLNTSLFVGLCFCGAAAAVCWIFTDGIVNLFLSDAAALSYASSFVHIMLSTAWLFGVFYVMMNALQAMGASLPSLTVSVCRQGLIYIPAIFLMNSLFGMYGLAWAQPVADLLSLTLVSVLLKRTRLTSE